MHRLSVLFKKVFVGGTWECHRTGYGGKYVRVMIDISRWYISGAYQGGYPGVSGNPFGFYTLLEILRN